MQPDAVSEERSAAGGRPRRRRLVSTLECRSKWSRGSLICFHSHICSSLSVCRLVRELEYVFGRQLERLLLRQLRGVELVLRLLVEVSEPERGVLRTAVHMRLLREQRPLRSAEAEAEMRQERRGAGGAAVVRVRSPCTLHAPLSLR
jgi:hypothetical protein